MGNKVIKLTIEEVNILQNIDIAYNYIARDKDGDLFLYSEKPIRNKKDGIWNVGGKIHPKAIAQFQIFNHLFTDLKWENEPLRFRWKIISSW